LGLYNSDDTNTDKRYNNMAIRRYTESVNTRFEVGIVRLLDEVLENSEWCKEQGFNRSDLVRHLVRVGLKNFESNQPKQREFVNEDRY
jgi:hypothetical protein